MDNQIKTGIMQGRLLPKYQGRYQAHPVGYWQDEFYLVSERNMDLIEFILDYNEVERNPLMSSEGVLEIQKKIDESGVEIKSICADYFMEAPFHNQSHELINKSVHVLNKLIDNSSFLDVDHIVIPCVDKSTLKVDDFNFFAKNIQRVVKNAQRKNINLCLETDLDPENFFDLLKILPYENVKVNYDLGNSASLGYDIEDEFNAYGDRISDIHIKDRILGGGPVELGKGDVDFNKAAKILKKINYDGIIIMQAYRDDEGISIFDIQHKFFKTKFSEIL